MLNKRQIIAIQMLTNKVDRMNRMSDGTALDGMFSFKVGPLANCDEVMVTGSNVDSDIRWYETFKAFVAFVGPRGGVKVKSQQGIRI